MEASVDRRARSLITSASRNRRMTTATTDDDDGVISRYRRNEAADRSATRLEKMTVNKAKLKDPRNRFRKVNSRLGASRPSARTRSGR